jgi:hypothetical protein
MALHGISTLMPANFSRVPASVRAGGPASVSPYCPSKNSLELPAKMLFKKKEKQNRCMGGAGTERGGSPTTRAFDNLKTDADWQGYVSSSHFLLELLSLHSFSPAQV